MKKCSHCQTYKDESEFFKNRSTPSGLQNLCKDCHRESWRRWAEKHPDVRNRATKRQRDHGCMRRYIQAHKEDIAAYMRDYHREHIAKWRAVCNKRRAREKGNGGSYTEREWKELCTRYGNICLCCKKSTKLVADHIIPVMAGGPSYIWNIQPLCQPCNRKKGTQIIDYRY